MSKIQIPENYQEALARKEEVLKLINAYNEALFNETELPCTDEEIELLQEEYAILDEYVELTDTEKEAYKNLEKVEYVEVTEEDGTVTKKEKITFWDKVNPLIFIYAVVPLIGSLWFAIQGIGIQFLNKFVELVDKYQWDFSDWKDGAITALFMAIIAIYPILFVLLSFIVASFICRKKETKIVGYIILIAHFVLIVINYIVVCSKIF